MTGITEDELSALPEKTKRDPNIVQFYRDHDFLTAYAKHTDYRIETRGAESAIGDPQDWDRYGELQRDFLISQGLKPGDTLLDVGCGTGRLSRKVVPYLNHNRYVGFDISERALDAAKDFAFSEGWYDRNPQFVTSLKDLTEPFDYLFSFSVLIHVPVEVMRETFCECRRLMNERSKFYFSYIPEPRDERTGLKQYRHRLETYVGAAESEGLSFRPVDSWSGRQRMAESRVFWRAMA